MTLLLDTHALLWWLDGDARLSSAARTAIAEPGRRVLVSAAPAWEIVTRHRLGKLSGAGAVACDVGGCVAAQGFEPLAVTMAYAERSGRLPGPHRDPFDRMLIAETLARDVAPTSAETLFDRHGARRLW